MADIDGQFRPPHGALRQRYGRGRLASKSSLASRVALLDVGGLKIGGATVVFILTAPRRRALSGALGQRFDRVAVLLVAWFLPWHALLPCYGGPFRTSLAAELLSI